MKIFGVTGLRAFVTGVGALLLLAVSPGVSWANGPGLASTYAAAMKEGSVTIWATNAEDVSWIQKEFEKTYPGIQVRVIADLNVAARLITEDRAGRRDADVVWNSEALVDPLIGRNLAEKPDWGQLGVDAGNIGAQGHMAYTNSVTFVMAYNRNLVRAADVPQKWDDILLPKYNGVMAASPFLTARLCAALGVYRGEDVMAEFARKLRTQSGVLWTNDLLEQVLASGERAYVAATAMHFVDRWIASGRPFGYSIPEPIFITQFGAIIMKRAPHPNAARLLVAWMASEPGKAARERAIFAIDLGPASMHSRAVELRKSGKKIHFDDAAARDRRNELIPQMDRILSGLN